MANKIYEIEFTEEGLTKLISKFARLSKLFESKEFKEYLLEKCKYARDQIMLDKDIAHIEENDGSSNQEKVDVYVAGNHEEISGDTITLYNNSHLSVEELTHFYNPMYRTTQYSDGFSIAELVEYGTGIRGAGSSLGTGDEWEYEVNEKRDYGEGWNYYGDNGLPEHTMGTEGKYIYYYLAKAIEDNLEDWVDEYIEEKMGSVL